MFIVVNAQLKTESNRFYICIYRLLSALTDLAEINNIHLKIIMSVFLNVWSIKVLLTLIVVDGPNLSAIYIYIYGLLTKLFRSRWLSIGQVPFLCAYGVKQTQGS